MATLASANMTRVIRTFMELFLPALENGFGIHARSSFASLASSGTRKPTRLIGRSVALLALPHPKCPFQVELLRVRASYCCFLVLGYYEVPGLYGYRTDPVNTAPYLSLDSLEGRCNDIELILESACVVTVLFGSRGVSPADPIETQ